MDVCEETPSRPDLVEMRRLSLNNCSVVAATFGVERSAIYYREAA